MFLKPLKGEIAGHWSSTIGKNTFRKVTIYPMVGQHFQGDLNGFAEFGVERDRSGNVLFMQVPAVGSQAFMRKWAAVKIKGCGDRAVCQVDAWRCIC